MVGVLTSVFPVELVDLAVEEEGAAEERYRKLPARVVAYFAMACVLFFGCGYGEVWNKLLTGMTWAKRYRARREADMQVSTAALTTARGRLGWEPMAAVLEKVMTPVQAGPGQAPWAYFHGLRTVAVDGFTMNIPKTPVNVGFFGLPGSSGSTVAAYPQVRVVALAECGTRSLQGVAVGPLSQGEQTLARSALWTRLGPGDLLVGDRGFLSYADLAAITATGAQVVLRAKADTDLPVLRVQSDGSYLSRIADPAASKRLRGKGRTPGDIPGIEVRVVEYTVEDPDGGVSELICLVTTCLDTETYPIESFPDLYHDRWQIETAIGDVETRLRGGTEVILRSKSPTMILQEVYGLLCVYQAIRTVMNAGADQAGLDPDRISFTRTREAAARHLSDDAAFSP
jgi:hypothetical protein